MNLGKGLNLLEIGSIGGTRGSWIIYEHISPSNKIYVGITSKMPNKRWRNGNGYNNCTIFQRAICKYGWNNFQHNIIASNLGEKTAKNMEKDLIAFYKANSISYNITDGGDGHLGCKWNPTKPTRELWSMQRVGRAISDDWKSKISQSMKGKVFDVAVLQKAVKGVKDKLSKPIIQLSMDGRFVREFPSIREAAKELGISSPRDIIRCCKGERKSRGGYKWKYKKEEI